VIDAVVSGNGGDRNAGNAAGGHQLGLELRAVGATAAASRSELLVGVHVSTIFCVDTMLLDNRRHCQMGWPDAYRGSVGRSSSQASRVATAVSARPRRQIGTLNTVTAHSSYNDSAVA
jgi:hypothetical protein